MSPDIDPAALERFLAARFGPGPMTLGRVAGGQSNPTYFVTHGGRRMVLRKQPAGPILRGAHAIDREYRVLRALEGTDVPVPRPILYHPEADLLGTPFYLMERIEGRVFADGALTEAAPGERRALWMALADALARLHGIDPQAVGLGDFGRPGNYFERQIARWSGQWQASDHPPLPALDRLTDWLVAHLPADDGAVALAHGDYRMGNVLFHPTEPRVTAILDWELATLGHPLADLGYCCMAWHTTPQDYGGIGGLDLAGLGLPDEAAFVARYLAARPGSAPPTRFHRVFALYRFAVIWVGIQDRLRSGTAAGGDAARHADLPRRLAETALELTRCPA